MTSPVENFKNNLFGQLKTYGDAVQNTFEQRIARPLLAFKRDLIRSTSTNRSSSDREYSLVNQEPIFTTRQETLLASTPLEIIDIHTDESLKEIFDKVKCTLSPSTQRHISDKIAIDEKKTSIVKQRHASITPLSNKSSRKNRLRNFKSVSFADDLPDDNFSPKSIDCDHNQKTCINETNSIESPTFEDNENNFKEHFQRLIQPRRVSLGGNRSDLICRDLSAEIVGYILKHALKICEKEDEDFLLAQQTQNEDYIDLK